MHQRWKTALSRTPLAVLGALAVGVTACSSSDGPDDADGESDRRRVVVMVSGVLSFTPFTTPDEVCASGFGAGNTNTFLRDHFTAAGLEVFTLPARIGDAPVEESDDPAVGPFGDCPEALPTEVTLNTTSTFETGGDRIRAFVQYLHDVHDVTDVDLVAHSTGGPWTRSGIAAMQQAGTPVRVASLSTIGSPWESPMIARLRDPADPLSACDGEPVCESFAQGIVEFLPAVAALMDQMGDGYAAWSEGLVGSLDDIPATLVAGTYFTREGGDVEHWPNDAVVHEQGATGSNIPASILPVKTAHVFANVHSLFVARQMGLPDELALTWNPEVGDVIVAGIRSAS
jgi:triacylglycerol lipase